MRPAYTPFLPLGGEPHEVSIHNVEQQALPFHRQDRDEINIDRVSDSSDLPIEMVSVWRNLQELKTNFKDHPSLKYRRCLGWGGNGLAAAFDILDEAGRKTRSVTVKMLSWDEDSRVDREIDRGECELSHIRDILDCISA
jgi:hypothetical protein